MNMFRTWFSLISPRFLVTALFAQILLFNHVFAQDWPNLNRYAHDAERLMNEPVQKDRVVFMGNSITDFWIRYSPEFFSANHFVDRGISGQTSPQMLIRFKQDVVDLKPAAVVIECGTNDIAGNTGPSTLKMIEDNISSMAEIAIAHKIKVVLGSVLPSNHFGWSPNVQPAERIDSLNQWIRKYSKENHLTYIDYYSSLVNEEMGMKREYSMDGVHPNKLGYTVMEKLAAEAIRKALKKRRY